MKTYVYSELDKSKSYKDNDGTRWAYIKGDWCFYSTYEKNKGWLPCVPHSDKEYTFTEFDSTFERLMNNDVENIDRESKATDVQIGGGHYKDMKIQPIEYIMKNNLNFCQGNVIKYISRYKHKNGLEDLKKVKHYVDLIIQLEGYESDKIRS